MGDVIWSTDFRAKQAFEKAQLHALSQALASDECFIEMSIEERVRRSIYHSAGLPYPKDSA